MEVMLYFQASEVKKEARESTYIAQEASLLVIHRDPFLFGMLWGIGYQNTKISTWICQLKVFDVLPHIFQRI